MTHRLTCGGLSSRERRESFHTLPESLLLFFFLLLISCTASNLREASIWSPESKGTPSQTMKQLTVTINRYLRLISDFLRCDLNLMQKHISKLAGSSRQEQSQEGSSASSRPEMFPGVCCPLALFDKVCLLHCINILKPNNHI